MTFARFGIKKSSFVMFILFQIIYITSHCIWRTSKPPGHSSTTILFSVLTKLQTFIQVIFHCNSATYASLSSVIFWMSFPDWKLFVGCVIRTLGLNIRGIEKNSRSERERIFEEEECIVQINDTELIDKSFAQWVSDSFIRHTFIVVMWITNRPPALFLSTSISSFIIRLLCCSMRLFSVLVARSVQTQSSQTFCPCC